VFVYAADLGPVIAAIRGVLAERGVLAFTVETHSGDDIVLGEKLRYAHGEVHVRSALDASGFEILHLEAAFTRTENGVPVPGLTVVATRG
jgi:predicted TPR repeat methyltransferase